MSTNSFTCRSPVPPEFKPPTNASSNIKGAHHDAAGLTVQFHSGATWHYPGVTAEDHAAMMNADSPGSHFHNYIKNKYPGMRTDK